MDPRALVRGGAGRLDTRALVRGGAGDTRALVRGGAGRLDTRVLALDGKGRLDSRPRVHGGPGRPTSKHSLPSRQDRQHCQLRSFWWQYSSECALLASCCASYEAACHTFWTHEEWMYNLLLHTTDDHFLKVVSAYQRFCARGASQGTCCVCGETGLEGNVILEQFKVSHTPW